MKKFLVQCSFVYLMNTVQTITKKADVLGIFQVITAVLVFVLLIHITRYLDKVRFGKYGCRVSFTALFGTFAGFRIYNQTIREITRKNELANEYFLNVSLIKHMLSFLAFFITLCKRL